MPAQCFLVFSTPRGVEHTHRRFIMKTCAFTGHRPKGLGYPESDERCTALKEKLRSLILKLIEEDRTLGIIIHDSLAFRKIQCMASVWLR